MLGDRPEKAGTMSTEGPGPLALLTGPTAPGSPARVVDPVPVLVALACIFLLLASCLLFLAFCKPAALDPSRHRARESMPHHPGSPSEPQLRLWKRLSSLRRSLHGLRRARPGPPGPPPGFQHEPDLERSEFTML
ncbi:uncharacterized protein C10orf105 homolog [Sorex araneus]|uniref:uncharacterized protein C10orf105 homolog n=1 Tax=Sorex araneus TaxID=42254 RepID=UPI00064AB42B|nr:uncharacterized protein C10orf105 homolog [Sorex araneus]